MDTLGSFISVCNIFNIKLLYNVYTKFNLRFICVCVQGWMFREMCGVFVYYVCYTCVCLLGITFYYIINGPGNASSQAEKRQSDEVLNIAGLGVPYW